jgi:hypothetical protein
VGLNTAIPSASEHLKTPVKGPVEITRVSRHALYWMCGRIRASIEKADYTAISSAGEQSFQWSDEEADQAIASKLRYTSQQVDKTPAPRPLLLVTKPVIYQH